MISSQCEHSPARQKIEVPVTFGIEKPRAFSTNVVLIETDGPDHRYKRGINMALVQFVLAALLAVEPFEKFWVHKKHSSRSWLTQPCQITPYLYWPGGRVYGSPANFYGSPEDRPDRYN